MNFSSIQLTPFEWMMVEDGGQPAPMTFTILLELSGVFEPDLFESSLIRILLSSAVAQRGGFAR